MNLNQLLDLIIVPVFFIVDVLVIWEASILYRGIRTDRTITSLHERLVGALCRLTGIVLGETVILNRFFDWGLLDREAGVAITILAVAILSIPSIRFLRIYRK